MKENTGFQPVCTMRQIRREASKQELPPNDPRHVDLSPVRGNVVSKLLVELNTEPDDFMHIAFAGQRGGGKTTILFEVAEKLHERHAFPVYLNCYSDLPLDDELAFTDILLYLTHGVLEAVANVASVQADTLHLVEEWFLDSTQIKRETIEEEIKLTAQGDATIGIPFLAKLLARIQARIKGRTDDTMEIRQRLRKSPDDLVRQINYVLSLLTDSLREKGYDRIVVMLDALDHYPSYVVNKAVVEYARIFTKLHTNLVLTVSLESVHLPKGETISSKGIRVHTMPTISIRRKNQTWQESILENVQCLKQVVAKRVDVETVFADPELVAEMILLSGGSLRDLLDILYNCAVQAEMVEKDKIDQDVFKCGARDSYSALTRQLSHSDYPTLRDIHYTKDYDRSNRGFLFLHWRFILEYNGEQWFDVHPLIFHSESFQAYLAEHPYP